MENRSGNVLKMATSIQFKKIFSQVAAEHGFQSAFSGWFLPTPRGLVVLCLQKSNYGNYFDLLVKVYLNGLFADHYRPEKKLVTKEVGDIFLTAPRNFASSLSLEVERDEPQIRSELEKLFVEFAGPMALGLSTLAGIQALSSENRVHLLPVVREFVNNPTNESG